jgi:hypothetical protein
MHYNNIKISIREEKSNKNGIKHDIQYYYTPTATLDLNNNLVYYLMSNAYAFSLPIYDPFPATQPTYIPQNYSSLFPEPV